MYRYIVILLSVEFYLVCWGAPTDTKIVHNISDELTKLANNCSSPVLVEHIKKKSNDCEVSVPTFKSNPSSAQFQCLLFYDINSQLCAAVTTLKLEIKEDSLSQIQTEQNASDLCKAAADWKFTGLPSQYVKTAETVFKNPFSCFRACVVVTDDVLKEDTNFYCKYFKWGSDLLKTVSIHSTGVSTTQHSNLVVGEGNERQAPASEPLEKTAVGAGIKPVTMTQDKLANSNTATDKSTSTVINTGEAPKEPNAENTLSNKKETALDISSNNKDGTIDIPKDTAVGEIPTEKGGGSVDGGRTASAPSVGSKVEDGLSEPHETVESQKLRKDQDNEDYQDGDGEGDDTKEGFGETQVEEDNLALPDIDTKSDELEKKEKHRIGPIGNQFSNDIAKEIYPNSISDEFSEDDDHFFPFFLTAIIMVVLMYVLYHNKSKVSKVVLGLIVEGRQAGRRRNSRGHAYRRLDTLEQAMSTNTAAPPSKIIY